MSSLERRGATGITGFSNFSFDNVIVCDWLTGTTRSILRGCSGFLEIDTAEFSHVGWMDLVETIGSDFSNTTEVNFSEKGTVLLFVNNISDTAKRKLFSALIQET